MEMATDAAPVSPGRGRRRLRGGFRVWLPDHRSREGLLYARLLRAGLELAGRPVPERLPRGLALFNGSELLRIEVECYARAGVIYDRATKHWGELQAKRARRRFGGGTVPTLAQVERAARRVGLCEGSFKEATRRLEALAAKHHAHPDLAKQVQLLQGGARG